ncbi:hypothetical protein B9T62_05235 [Paenibacillus donghaensis]|uniref:Uncharacterized protein n=1 Tax=Paenibacillus donghaensis TaxID=414771 RepID=A0A2Z2K3W7_9BACL|nr:hypothetical protein B9T62_05235 [Paenibacillus donghaensis]
MLLAKALKADPVTKAETVFLEVFIEVILFTLFLLAKALKADPVNKAETILVFLEVILFTLFLVTNFSFLFIITTRFHKFIPYDIYYESMKK